MKKKGDFESVSFLTNPFTSDERVTSQEESNFPVNVDLEIDKLSNLKQPNSLEEQARLKLRKNLHKSTLEGALTKAAAHLETLHGLAQKKSTASPPSDKRKLDVSKLKSQVSERFVKGAEEQLIEDNGVDESKDEGSPPPAEGSFNFAKNLVSKSNSRMNRVKKLNNSVAAALNYVAPTGKSTLSALFSGAGDVKQREDAGLDPESDKYLIIILNKFAREIGEKLRGSMSLITAHRFRIGSTDLMAAAKSAELNRILPPLVENFISSFSDKMMGKRSEKSFNKESQTDESQSSDMSQTQGASKTSGNRSILSPFANLKSGVAAVGNALINAAKGKSSNKVGGGFASTGMNTSSRRLSEVEVKAQRQETEKLAKMMKATLGSMKQGAKNFVKMDPSMLPQSFQGLITSFKLNAKNLEKCAQKCKGEQALMKAISELMSDVVNREFANGEMPNSQLQIGIFLSHIYTHTHTLSLFFSPPALSHTHICAQSLSLSHTKTHAHTLSLSQVKLYRKKIQ